MHPHWSGLSTVDEDVLKSLADLGVYRGWAIIDQKAE